MDISNEHACPGGCGAVVENRLFACKPCWQRLPHDLRQRIVHTRKMHLLSAERLTAVHAAQDFYEERLLTSPEERKALGDLVSSALHDAMQVPIDKATLDGYLQFPGDRG